MDQIVLKEFKSLEASSSFISKNFLRLQQEYANKYIAIEDSKIIANSSSFEEIVRELHKMNKQPSELIIEFIPKKGIIVLY